MNDEAQAFFALRKGYVVAPAGCGKTQLLSEVVSGHVGNKPALILTHTNAGVAALRQRFEKSGIDPRAFRLHTIDGWAIRLVATFPLRAGISAEALSALKPEYKYIRECAHHLLNSGHVNDVLVASYARLLVDEYQDCSQYQHAIVAKASELLPTIVFGDDMQAIFGFGNDPLADWGEVCAWYQNKLELKKPWRWINASTSPLGEWLLAQRDRLARNEHVDLSTAPAEVSWVRLTGGPEDVPNVIKACSIEVPSGSSVLIIGDSKKPASQRKIASQIKGAVTVEAVDLRDLVLFAQNLTLTSDDALSKILDFAEELMTAVGASELLARVATISTGKARKPATDVESAALTFVTERNAAAAARLIVCLSSMPGVRVFRPSIVNALLSALSACATSPGTKLDDAVVAIREQQRLGGRVLPARAVGSTLLLKGLEADTVVVLDGDQLNARNLYVALTRGSRRLVVCSKSKTLTP